MSGWRGEHRMRVLEGAELWAALNDPDPVRRLSIIPPPARNDIARGVLDLRLGEDVLIAPGVRQLRSRRSDAIPPGGIAMCQTMETVMMPSHLVAHLVVRASLARIGLMTSRVERVDPLFRGTLALELINMGTQTLKIHAGQRVATLVVYEEHHGAPPPYPDRVDEGAAAADLLLSFAEGSISLVAETGSGTRVLGPGDEIYDIVTVAAFSSARLLPALTELETLVSDAGVDEAEVQAFLAAYPEFLTGFEYVAAVPHVVLELEAGSVRVPDFVLKPATSDPCDLLEIKRPDARVVTYQAGRPMLSRTAGAGVAQLLEYSDALRSKAVRERVRARYGLDVAYPRLQLLIGRFRGSSAAVLRQAALGSGVEVRTYDQLLRRAELYLLPAKRRP